MQEPHRSRRARNGLLAAALVVGVVIPIPGMAASGLESIGSLPLEVGSAVVADSGARHLIEFGGGADPLSITVYDGDTLARIRRTVFPGFYPQAGSGGRPRIFAFDARTRVLHLIAYASQTEQTNTVNPQLLSIDVDHLTITRRASLASVFPPGVRILGVRAGEGSRLLFVGQVTPAAAVPLLFPLEAPRSSGVVLVEIDATGIVTWGPQPVRGCQSAITNQSQSALGVLGDTIFVGCATPQVLAAPLPGVPAIATVNRATPTEQHLHFLPGSYATGDIYEDAVARRLLVVGAAAGRPAQAVWVFDLAHSAFVGQIAAGEANVLGAGLDPATGRVYTDVDGAVLVATDRGYEIPQATALPVDANLGPISTIPFNRRLIIPLRAGNTGWRFGVFRDALPDDAFVPGAPVAFDSFDALVSDTPQFAGDAQAFGLRVHEIGGLNAVAQNVFPLRGNYWRDPGTLTGVRDGDRDVNFAAVRRAHLSEGDASGESIAADPDPNTESDHTTATATAADKTNGAVSAAWPYSTAECGDFGAGAKEATVPGATATCGFAKGDVKITSAFETAGLAGLISVGSATSTATLARDGTHGVSVRAEADARDIAIGATVQIGSVRSVAIASSAGARGTAHSSYTRTFENVVAGTFHCTTQCDASEVLRALTDALGENARVELPAAERLETPGGAHAHAFRDVWEHRQDVVVNNQDPNGAQVPALRLTYINDNTLASRAIVELAATKADATSVRLVVRAPIAAGPIPSAPRLVPPPPAVVPRTVGSIPHVSTQVKAPAAGAGEKVLRVLGHGWRLLTTGGAGMAARSIGLWGLLLLPGFLFVRGRSWSRGTQDSP